MFEAYEYLHIFHAPGQRRRRRAKMTVISKVLIFTVIVLL